MNHSVTKWDADQPEERRASLHDLRRALFVRVLTLDWVLALLVFAASLALYVRTVAPGLLDGDEGEFQTNIYKLGVSHTGYPFFFLLGKLWTILLPIGTIALRANLFSAFWGALAVAAIFIFVQFLTFNRWAAILCALLFAVSRVEWSQAIIPRVYTMNSLFVIVVTFLFFLWRAGKVDLTVPIFAFGLSLTNHRAMMWFAPAIAVFVFVAHFRLLWFSSGNNASLATKVREHERGAFVQPRRWLSLAAAFVLPLVLYSYIFWRGESDVGVEFHLKDFNDMILGGNVRTWARYGPIDWLVSRVTDLYIPLLIEQFTPIGFIAGWIGLIALVLNRPPSGWPRALPAREAFAFILLANLANSAFCVIFWVIDIDKFFLPSFITFLFFVGIGIAKIWDWLGARLASRPARPIAQNAAALLFVAAIGFLIARNFSINDWSKRTDIAEEWKENLLQPLEENAVIVGPWESLVPLEYSMYVDGRRRDLERWKVIIKKYQLGQVPYGSRQEDIERAVRAERPVYLTVHPSETETLGVLAEEFRLTRVGELWRVVNLSPNAAAPPSQPLAVFADGSGRAIELLGLTIYPTPKIRAGDFVLVTFFWRAPQALAARLTISLRLNDSQNRLIVQRDSEPASGRRATVGWTADEIIQDDEGFIVPPDVPSGVYRTGIIVYNAATGENLKPDNGADAAQGELFIANEFIIGQ